MAQRVRASYTFARRLTTRQIFSQKRLCPLLAVGSSLTAVIRGSTLKPTSLSTDWKRRHLMCCSIALIRHTCKANRTWPTCDTAHVHAYIRYTNLAVISFYGSKQYERQYRASYRWRGVIPTYDKHVEQAVAVMWKRLLGIWWRWPWRNGAWRWTQFVQKGELARMDGYSGSDTINYLYSETHSEPDTNPHSSNTTYMSIVLKVFFIWN